MSPYAVPAEDAGSGPAPQAEQVAQVLLAFLQAHPDGSVLEDGKAVFDLAAAQHRVAAEHGRCTLQVWSGDRNLVCTVVSLKERNGLLRLNTRRLGHPQTRTLAITAQTHRQEPARREPVRQAYLKLLQRVLAREFPDWQTEGFRTAMDLERSFGPAYARGTLVRGGEAWSVIGVGGTESQALVDGVLTPGILWLHHCREQSCGRPLFKGLRVVVPRGSGMLTCARMAWMNTAAAQWELFELDENSEELRALDPADQGNLRTRLVYHADEGAARERFAPALEQVLSLVPAEERHRVEQRLRSPAELAFLLHGLEFARARISLAPGSFSQVLEASIGVGASETVLSDSTRDLLREHLADLFRRRHPEAALRGRTLRPHPPGRGIGAFTGRPAHARTNGLAAAGGGLDRLEARERALAAQQDPLFRAAPERWLESVLRENLAPLTRSLGPVPQPSETTSQHWANDPDPDNRGNRATHAQESSWGGLKGRSGRDAERLIPRFNARFVYTQVPAIAGASDRGMLDLLGVTEDGRLAVIELKASDDLQLALQGLDYWIRVRHHQCSTAHAGTDHLAGPNDLQQHGYFRGVELSPLPPRLFLVAPALQIHPATETVLRYLSPRVEWTLLALDERWRQEIRVVWRKSGGHSAIRAAEPG